MSFQPLIPSIDAILGVRDSIGAIIEPIYLVTRTWYRDRAKQEAADQPEGWAGPDQVVQVLPTPMMKNFSQDVRLREGGAVKAGDIILAGFSKNRYQLSDLDGTTSAKNVQRLFMIGVKLYQVINVTEKYVTFDVQVRELTNQERY